MTHLPALSISHATCPSQESTHLRNSTARFAKSSRREGLLDGGESGAPQIVIAGVPSEAAAFSCVGRGASWQGTKLHCPVSALVIAEAEAPEPTFA